MTKVTNFNYQIVQEGTRISYTYSELNEDGDIISSNNKKSFIVTDDKILTKLKEIKSYLESKI
ncbi:MAG: hypothetical protein K1W19_08665 [Lachnospiraceae bacterium]